MPVATPAGLLLGAIAPSDAFAAFAARGLLRPSFRWQDVWAAEHARAFAVAGVLRLDILKLIFDQVEKSLARGTDLADFSRELKRQLVAKGFWGNIEVTDPATGEVRTTKFNDARLKLIYDVNLRQSHAAGRWARGMRTGNMTHIVYQTMEDERVRASHRPWDMICLPKDHPFWDTHIPPNGFGCRCRFFFVNQAGIERLQAAGKKLKFDPPEESFVDFRNTSTGLVERVPRGIDPGFAYNPGKAHVQRGLDRLVDSLTRLEQLRRGLGEAAGAAQATAGEGHALTRAVIHRQRSEPAFGAFLRDPPLPRTGEPPIGMPVAAVPPATASGGAQLPPVASVSAADLAAQKASETYPLALPEGAAAWAMVQAVIDRGQRLVLDAAETSVLWWWQRGDRVETVLLERGALVWWVKAQQRLTVEEAGQRYPRLAPLLTRS